jgi:cyanophycinase-like exopeptidase
VQEYFVFVAQQHLSAPGVLAQEQVAAWEAEEEQVGVLAAAQDEVTAVVVPDAEQVQVVALAAVEVLAAAQDEVPASVGAAEEQALVLERADLSVLLAQRDSVDYRYRHHLYSLPYLLLNFVCWFCFFLFLSF